MILGSSWRPAMLRALWMGFSVCVLLYSIAVLAHVAGMGTIGVRCVFGTKVEERVPDDYRWDPIRPQKGDTLEAIGSNEILENRYADYIRALRSLSGQVGNTIEVRWRDGETLEPRTARVLVQHPPSWTYYRSFAWFLQELLIFAIGARVFWKRPGDHSAAVFFAVCIVTVGAFMGGYHWTEIVTEPWLIYPFALFALFVPVVNLHFFWIFPRTNPILRGRRRLVVRGLYSITVIYLLVLWGSMVAARWLTLHPSPDRSTIAAFQLVEWLALGYVGWASVLFALCLCSLLVSYLKAPTRAERSQVQWILLATVISLLLISYLLAQTMNDPATLGRGRAAWPMFAVSLLYTMAYAFSITRYRLMQVDQFINRSAVYFALSRSAGLIYAGVLLVIGMLIGDQLLRARSTSRGAIAAALSVVLVLILFEMLRGRFQRAIDRQFFREKYKLDRAMDKMRLAVGSLIDRMTVGRRLLEAAAEVLRLEWGALYLCDGPSGSLELVAAHGPTPDEQMLAADHPLVARLRQTPAVRLSHAAASDAASDPATDAMIALGGEAATAVGGDGQLAGLLVLGPKRSGMPFEDEEMAFLGALSSVATLVLHSAGIQETLEKLNADLRDKVEKIAEQQRRILILQDQLRDRAEREREGVAHALDGPRAETASGTFADERVTAFGVIKGSSAALKKTIAMAGKVAATHSAVLIRGESGTGKELLAAAIHHASQRAAGPFVKLHCAALSQSLLESELFGHVKSAFTGADRDRVGRFEQANGGTLFLDEIGDINLEIQTKLLRVLQEMSFERVGSSQPITVDVRILAATHQDLDVLIRAGRFREDLYYRLNVISLYVPALRERREDIFELAVHFLNLHAQRTGKLVTHLDPEAVEALVAYDWPGNIRELENVVERAVVLSDGAAVTLDDLPVEFRQPARRRVRPRLPVIAAPGPVSSGLASRPGTTGISRGSARSTPRALPPPSDWTGGEIAPAAGDDWNSEFLAYERERLLDALKEAGGNKSVAARLLGMPRSTFTSKMKKHGIA
jgi:transcriptional regulator with GAF, ATPase, and Fis domain